MFYLTGEADPIFSTALVDETIAFYETSVYTGEFVKNLETHKAIPGLVHEVPPASIEKLIKWYDGTTDEITSGAYALAASAAALLIAAA